MDVSLGTVFVSEFLGTGLLLLMGLGVAMNLQLVRTYGGNGTTLMGAFGWGLGVYCAIFIAGRSGAHINPAVTIGKIFEGSGEFAPGIAITVASTLVYLSAQLLGAFVGSLLAWFVYRQHFDATDDPDVRLKSMVTYPAIRKHSHNFLVEVIATFVLVWVILSQSSTPSGLGPLAVGLVVIGIGVTLGGNTNWSLNPARDLSARVAHAIVPMRNRGSNDWGYWWPPVVGPLVGGALAGLAAAAW
ncbi:MIP/aquaporin family protein [Luteimicrobium subarcticum]|uniref:Glycerol uptake facilitator protein n=1 Tax=Luteimicrobium subarcticum TaxID=620910 RepID=A0A2M8WVX5_9MICO|nr:MIP/aquaporin family protein [Luteimicrobium subarcticum]PJI95063.1 glycerol uptake facilitator protein [Luteimicrobium subarcticum]